MTSIFLLNTEKLNDAALFSEYYRKMSDYRKSKTDRMKLGKDKILSLGAGIVIDSYLNSVGLCEKDMLYGEGDYGKPYFKNRPEIRFNLSHSHSAVICAFSESEVGCDIEKISDASTAVAKRFFTENESRCIFSSSDENEQKNRFFRLWTLKESFLKCTGQGLGGGLSSFEICFDNGIYVKQASPQIDCYFREFSVPGYRISVCCEADGFSDKLNIIEI